MANPNIWTPENSAELIREVLALFSGTSTTSTLIKDTGTITFSTQPDLYFTANDWLVITDAGNTDNWMSGHVVTYNSTTGVLVFAPQVSSGTGTHANWIIRISGVWVPLQWDGGAVVDPTTFEDIVTFDADVTMGAALTVNGLMTVPRTIRCSSGDVNLSSNLILDDVNYNLTIGDIFNNTLIINPTATRVLSMPTAAAILASMATEEVGSNFTFNIINNSANKNITLGGNTGIVQIGVTTIPPGAAQFRVTVQSPTIIEVACIAVNVVSTSISTIDSSLIQTSSSDITLSSSSARLIQVNMTQEGQSVILPAATTLSIVAPYCIIENIGAYHFAVRNSAGTILTFAEPGAVLNIALVDNSTIAGIWTVGGSGKTGVAANWSSVLLSSTYDGSTPIALACKLTDATSIHFVNLAANGFAVFVADHTNKVIGTPVTVSVTASMKPKEVFRIDDTSALLFYSVTSAPTIINAVVITVSGTVPTVNSAANLTVASSTLGTSSDGIGSPKIAQLDSNLFALAYGTTSNNFIVGVQVSGGVLVNFGTAVSLGANSNSSNTQTVFKLTNTTALVLHKIGTANPLQGRAVVVTLTNANPPVCTLGTAINTIQGCTGDASSALMIDATHCAILDHNNGASQTMSLVIVEVTGTALGINSPVSFSSVSGHGFSITGGNYSFGQGSGNRTNPHMILTSPGSLLIWVADSGNASIITAATIAYPTVTMGPVVVESLYSTDGGLGMGMVLGGGNGGALALVADSSTSYAVIPISVSGNAVTIGRGLPVIARDPISNTLLEYISGAYLGNGYYLVNVSQNSLSMRGFGTLALVKLNGLSARLVGMFPMYPSNRQPQLIKDYCAFTSNKLSLTVATMEKFNSSTEYLRFIEYDYSTI